MQTRWLTAVIVCPTNARRTIASARYNGPILIRGASWGGVPSGGGNATLDFGYVEDSGAPLGNGSGLILENNVPLATPPAYTRFNIHRLHTDASLLVEGFPEFGGQTGPPNWRPLHFIIPTKSGRLCLSVWNVSGVAATVGVNVEIVEEIPQMFLDCLRHLVM